MAHNQFFQIISGLTLLLIQSDRFVKFEKYEDLAEHVFLTVRDQAGEYRVEINHQWVNTQSILKVRLYEGSRGSMHQLQPRINSLNSLHLHKWEHFAGTICTSANFVFLKDSVNQDSLKSMLSSLEISLRSIYEVSK